MIWSARHVTCAKCLNARAFILHGETSRRLLGQSEAARQPKGSTLCCGVCGSSFLLISWPETTAGFRVLGGGAWHTAQSAMRGGRFEQ